VSAIFSADIWPTAIRHRLSSAQPCSWGSVYLLLLPAFAEPLLQVLVWQIDDIKLGSLASALAIMFFPVTFLGMYSPFGIRLLLRSKQHSGVVSGRVYGISTAGSILGTLGTTFCLIPLIGFACDHHRARRCGHPCERCWSPPRWRGAGDTPGLA